MTDTEVKFQLGFYRNFKGKNGEKLLKGKTREFWTYYIVFFAKKPFLHSAAGCWLVLGLPPYLHMQKSKPAGSSPMQQSAARNVILCK